MGDVVNRSRKFLRSLQLQRSLQLPRLHRLLEFLPSLGFQWVPRSQRAGWSLRAKKSQQSMVPMRFLKSQKSQRALRLQRFLKLLALQEFGGGGSGAGHPVGGQRNIFAPKNIFCLRSTNKISTVSGNCKNFVCGSQTKFPQIQEIIEIFVCDSQTKLSHFPEIVTR